MPKQSPSHQQNLNRKIIPNGTKVSIWTKKGYNVGYVMKYIEEKSQLKYKISNPDDPHKHYAVFSAVNVTAPYSKGDVFVDKERNTYVIKKQDFVIGHEYEWVQECNITYETYKEASDGTTSRVTLLHDKLMEMEISNILTTKRANTEMVYYDYILETYFDCIVRDVHLDYNGKREYTIRVAKEDTNTYVTVGTLENLHCVENDPRNDVEFEQDGETKRGKIMTRTIDSKKGLELLVFPDKGDTPVTVFPLATRVTYLPLGNKKPASGVGTTTPTTSLKNARAVVSPAKVNATPTGRFSGNGGQGQTRVPFGATPPVNGSYTPENRGGNQPNPDGVKPPVQPFSANEAESPSSPGSAFGLSLPRATGSNPPIKFAYVDISENPYLITATKNEEGETYEADVEDLRTGTTETKVMDESTIQTLREMEVEKPFTVITKHGVYRIITRKKPDSENHYIYKQPIFTLNDEPARKLHGPEKYWQKLKARKVRDAFTTTSVDGTSFRVLILNQSGSAPYRTFDVLIQSVKTRNLKTHVFDEETLRKYYESKQPDAELKIFELPAGAQKVQSPGYADLRFLNSHFVSLSGDPQSSQGVDESLSNAEVSSGGSGLKELGQPQQQMKEGTNVAYTLEGVEDVGVVEKRLVDKTYRIWNGFKSLILNNDQIKKVILPSEGIKVDKVQTDKLRTICIYDEVVVYDNRHQVEICTVESRTVNGGFRVKFLPSKSYLATPQTRVFAAEEVYPIYQPFDKIAFLSAANKERRGFVIEENRKINDLIYTVVDLVNNVYTVPQTQITGYVLQEKSLTNSDKGHIRQLFELARNGSSIVDNPSWSSVFEGGNGSALNNEEDDVVTSSDDDTVSPSDDDTVSPLPTATGKKNNGTLKKRQPNGGEARLGSSGVSRGNGQTSTFKRPKLGVFGRQGPPGPRSARRVAAGGVAAAPLVRPPPRLPGPAKGEIRAKYRDLTDAEWEEVKQEAAEAAKKRTALTAPMKAEDRTWKNSPETIPTLPASSTSYYSWLKTSAKPFHTTPTLPIASRDRTWKNDPSSIPTLSSAAPKFSTDDYVMTKALKFGEILTFRDDAGRYRYTITLPNTKLVRNIDEKDLIKVSDLNEVTNLRRKIRNKYKLLEAANAAGAASARSTRRAAETPIASSGSLPATAAEFKPFETQDKTGALIEIYNFRQRDNGDISAIYNDTSTVEPPTRIRFGLKVLQGFWKQRRR